VNKPINIQLKNGSVCGLSHFLRPLVGKKEPSSFLPELRTFQMMATKNKILL